MLVCVYENNDHRMFSSRVYRMTRLHLAYEKLPIEINRDVNSTSFGILQHPRQRKTDSSRLPGGIFRLMHQNAKSHKTRPGARKKLS